jgi:GT2 family glycosyltransferase
MNLKFRFICATRESVDGFRSRTALGRSLAQYMPGSTELKLYANNRLGLPRLYNHAIREAANDPATLIFIHDDVHLCDFFWPAHIAVGLRAFDIIGVAGNIRRAPRQPSWIHVDDSFNIDASQYLSGVVAHGQGFPPASVEIYGPPGQQVKLLDGVLMAAHSATLLSRQIAFDERFDFHFYDMDFCRQAEQKQLRLGTWTISIVHESGGGYSAASWRAAYERYLEKWQS